MHFKVRHVGLEPTQLSVESETRFVFVCRGSFCPLLHLNSEASVLCRITSHESYVVCSLCVGLSLFGKRASFLSQEVAFYQWLALEEAELLFVLSMGIWHDCLVLASSHSMPVNSFAFAV